MVTKALLLHLHARHGMTTDVEQLLKLAVPEVEREPGTTAWFAVRFGRGHYGIFAAFPDDEAREAHLGGAVAAAIGRGAPALDEPAEIHRLDVLAAKLPTGPVAGDITRGLLLTLAAKEGHVDDVEAFLRSGRQLVEEEAGTVAWLAIGLGGGRYGIFDVFADNAARFAHLTGRVPRELAKHALELLGSFPDMDMLSVLEWTFH